MSFVPIGVLKNRDRPRVWLAWGGGKESAWLLHRMRQQAELDPVGLVTVMDPSSGHVYGRRLIRELVEEQARSVGLSCIFVDADPSEPGGFGRALQSLAEQAKEAGVRRIAFGDVSSTSRRTRHQAALDGTELEAVFPLWGEDAAVLCRQMLAAGLRPVVTGVDTRHLPLAIAGRVFSEDLIAELDPAFDPSGEAGEIQTFVCGGPELTRPISPRLFDMVQVDGHYHAILGPGPMRAYGDL